MILYDDLPSSSHADIQAAECKQASLRMLWSSGGWAYSFNLILSKAEPQGRAIC